MAVVVLMPKLGMTMEEGKLLEWSKNEKDSVQKDEIVCIIETDKVTYEVESPGTGILAILMEPAEKIPVGTIMGYLAESEEEYQEIIKGAARAVAETTQAAPSEKGDEGKPEAVASKAIESDGKFRCSPAARALAKKQGISLEGISGTGPKGRITTEDVKQAAAGAAPVKVDATAGARMFAQEKGIDLGTINGTGPNGQISRRDVLQAIKSGVGAVSAPAQVPADFKGKRLLKEEPMTGIRNTISCRMMESLECSAQMTAFAEWDVTNLMELRKLLNAQVKDKESKVSFPGLIVFFLARVLKEMPVFNASVKDNCIHYWEDVNIGVAVSVGDNLVVPVVHGAERQSLNQIQSTLADLIERARNKKMMPDDMSGGTFTLSNVGSYGSQWETVILNPPEVALMGIGSIEKKPVVVDDDQIVIRKMMPISLTFDHRIIDGATAGAFRNRMKMLVEHPEMLISCF